LDDELQMTEKEKREPCWNGEKWHDRVTNRFDDWVKTYAFLDIEKLSATCIEKFKTLPVGEFLATVTQEVYDWYFDADYEDFLSKTPKQDSDSLRMQFWSDKFERELDKFDAGSEEEEAQTSSKAAQKAAPVVASNAQKTSSSSWWMCRHG